MILGKTETGIYYLHYYYPRRYFSKVGEESKLVSNEILCYKNMQEPFFTEYTNELMAGISEVSGSIKTDRIALVAVPPSKPDKISPVAESIGIIKEWYDNGVAEEKFGCTKRIMDFGSLLTRTEPVITSHKHRQRATYEDHLSSISCLRDNIFKYRATYILIDDITTTGTSMDACRDILMAHGAGEKYIFRMAIAKTDRGNNEEIHRTAVPKTA